MQGAHRAHRRRFRLDQRAVSPVIGTVLVLFIVLMAMAGILSWGVPAIQGLQEHAEFQSVLTQMIQTDQELRVLRDPQNTRRTPISMNTGQLNVYEGSRWVVAVHLDPDYTNLNVTGWESDTSSALVLRNFTATSNKNVTVDRVQGGTFTSSATTTTCTQDCAMTLSHRPNDNTTRIQVRMASVLKAEVWIFEAGRITYRLSTTDTTNRAHIEMGAVFQQQGTSLFLEETPTIKEPDFTVNPEDASYLFRALQLEGNTSASGKGRHQVLGHLVDNYGIARGRPSLENASSVRIQIDDSGAANTEGLLEEGFCNILDKQTYYTEGDGLCDNGDVNVVYNPGRKFTFELSQSVVNVDVDQFG